MIITRKTGFIWRSRVIKIAIALGIGMLFFSLVAYFILTTPGKLGFFTQKIISETVNNSPNLNLLQLQDIKNATTESQVIFKCQFVDTKILLSSNEGWCLFEAYDLQNLSFKDNFSYLEELDSNKQKIFFYDTNKSLETIKYFDLSTIFGDQKIENTKELENKKWQFEVENVKYTSDPNFQNIEKN